MPSQISCTVPALGRAGALQVYDFAGEEGLSRLFSFELIAASVDAPIALEDLIRQKVKLSLTVSAEGSGHRPRDFHGIVTSVTDWGEGQGDRYYFFYRMTVRPLAWLLTLNRRSRVFRSTSVPDLIALLLEDNGFGPSDYRFELQGTYPTPDYTVQHEETDWDFLCRLAEYEGIFYYFVPEGDRQVLVFRDTNPEVGSDLDIGDVRLIASISLQTDQVHLNQFAGRWRMTTGNVAVWDNDYEGFPSGTYVERVAASDDAPDLHGTYEEYGERVKEPHPPTAWSGEAAGVEGETKDKRAARVKQLAERRRQEIVANEGKYYVGSSNEALFAHGSVFKLVGKGRTAERYGGRYLVTSVRHVGSERAAFMGLSFENRPREETYGEAFESLFQLLRTGAGETPSGYANSIACIELATPYRPPRRTPWPRIPGVVTGKIERYPGERLLDQEGRYMVRLAPNQMGEAPSGTPANEPSRPVRMAQWLSLRDGGVHFPTDEGAETVVAFIDGDPDRPIIVGMVPNMETHAPVPNTSLGLGSENPDEETWRDQPISYDEKKNVLRTSAGHQFVMDDDTGKANVGITLQVGVTPPEAAEGDGEQHKPEPDVYWGSKVELGGHRVKGKIEREVDAKTQGLGGLGDDASKPGDLKSLVQNALDDRDYWEDATSSVTPVGVHAFTNNRVELVGKNGIDLYAPGLADPHGGRGPAALDIDQNRGRLVAVSKFLTNVLWRSVFKRLKEHVTKVLNERRNMYHNEVTAGPVLGQVSKYDYEKGNRRQDARAYEALRLPGIRVGAAGPVTVASFTSVDAVAGKGGFNVESFGDVVQHAGEDAVIEAGHMIKLRTTGMRASSSVLDDTADALKSRLSGTAQQLAAEALSKAKATHAALYEAGNAGSYKYFPILLQNQSGGIVLHTEGVGGNESKGHIDLYAEGNGEIRARAVGGKIAAHSTKEIMLKVEKEGKEKLEKFYDGPMIDEAIEGAKVVLSPTNLEGFAREFVRLQTAKDSKGDKNGPSIEIDRDSTITLQCGESKITLKKDGTIEIRGMKINLVAAQSITQDAKVEVKTTATNITSEAKAQHNVKGAFTTVEASGILTHKGGMVMIN